MLVREFYDVDHRFRSRFDWDHIRWNLESLENATANVEFKYNAAIFDENTEGGRERSARSNW
jgi:hypothetical protein